jgi:plastocyanin
MGLALLWSPELLAQGTTAEPAAPSPPAAVSPAPPPSAPEKKVKKLRKKKPRPAVPAPNVAAPQAPPVQPTAPTAPAAQTPPAQPLSSPASPARPIVPAVPAPPAPAGTSSGRPPSSQEIFVPAPKVQLEELAGSLVIGRVIFKGAVPPPRLVVNDRDANVCGTSIALQLIEIETASRGLQNAIVSADVPGDPASVTSMTAQIRNQKCAFISRIGVTRTGSTFEIVNEDPIMHNTNVTSENRSVVNVAMVPGSNPIRKPLKRSGVHRIQCNVHKFMQAYRVVFDHPYFTMTDYRGEFRLGGLPPGPRKISVWHETLGLLQKDVVVPAKGQVTVDFEYTSVPPAS